MQANPITRPSTSLSIRQRIVIYRPVDEVFAYLDDEDRARALFTRMLSPSIRSERPPTRTVHERDRYLAFRDGAARVPAYGDFRFAAVQGGTRLEFTLNLELIGTWRWLAAYVKLTAPRLIIQELRELRGQLESAPALVAA